MAIIGIVKQVELDGSDKKYKKNAPKPKVKSVDKEVSLNSLNLNTKKTYDFGKDKNPEMAYGKLKTERGITRTIFSTIFNVFFFIAIVVGGVFAFFKISGLSFNLFELRDYYTLQQFNSDLGKFILILLGMLMVSSFLMLIFINLSVKIRFRKSYLSKTNVYIYGMFICILNVLLYTLLAVVFFNIINSYNTLFVEWYGKNMIDPEASLDILGIFKYVIVVVVAVFMSLNSFRGIAIIHKKNQFIFENHL